LLEAAFTFPFAPAHLRCIRHSEARKPIIVAKLQFFIGSAP
jgi:hypothetical protein